MPFKKVFLLYFLCMVFIGICQAQELTAKEAVAYYNEGVRAQKNGEFDAASKAYQKAAIMTSYYDKFIMHNKAVMYAQSGDLDKAEELFKQVLNLDSTYMPARINLGLIYDVKEDRCKALDYWAEIFELEKRKPKTFVIENEQKAKD